MKNPADSKRCYVSWVAPATRQQAQSLADRLALPLAEPIPPAPVILLELTGERLQLRSTADGAPGAVYADFARLAHRRDHGSLRKEAIARAAGLRGDRQTQILDATAGLGRDGFMLASLGARVTLIERSPLIAALLEDGIRRAAAQDRLMATAARLSLINTEAEAILKQCPKQEGPEVVYLDPMYPPQGTRAQVKKEMQLLRELLGSEADPQSLLAAALAAARRRVVVKRPLKAPPIGGPKPSYQIAGRSTRFDVYVLAS